MNALHYAIAGTAILVAGAIVVAYVAPDPPWTRAEYICTPEESEKVKKAMAVCEANSPAREHCAAAQRAKFCRKRN